MKKLANRNQRMFKKSTQSGAILLEALIAIVIFSMGILAVAGLQATMIRNTTDANYRAEATYIAQQTIGLMWADPKNLASYEDEAGSDISSLPNGKLFISRPNSNEQVRVTVRWQLEGGEQHQVVTNARITGDVL